MIWARVLPSLPTPRLTAFSFGGGVQSTTILMLLKHQPEIFTNEGLTLPTVAFFADTGAEKQTVLDHVARLDRYGLPIPIKVVKNHKNGGDLDQIGRPPWFVKGPVFQKEPIVDADGNLDGERFVLDAQGNRIVVPGATTNGQILRSCTDKWKIRPLERAARLEAGFKKGQVVPPGSIHLWIGISTDEIQRAKDNPKKHSVNLYPLVEIGWDRNRCKEFLRSVLPWNVPKSACFYCPFTSPAEWSRVKREEPEQWAKAVEWDRLLRSDNSLVRKDVYMEGECFMHPARVPIDEAVAAWDEDRARRTAGQTPLFPEFDAFDAECSGMCGV